ncbi:hypothetical protein F5882DRAFT_503368 [Hyaloscypha sp. PMI_1271]|nr:hypothetical protein F5882DRAFT_503368 [Hyaloscypha sp. PMI_1271]
MEIVILYEKNAERQGMDFGTSLRRQRLAVGFQVHRVVCASAVLAVPTNFASDPMIRMMPTISNRARDLTSLIANTQAQIDAIVAARPAGPVAPEMLPIPSWERISHPAPRMASLMSMRRTTLKSWIHEGTCALTQMGCKYRHEMPMDRTVGGEEEDAIKEDGGPKTPRKRKSLVKFPVDV